MAALRRLSSEALSSSAPYDAIIVGAGIIGSSIALELSRAGLRTLNIDAEPAAGHGSTSYSSGIIRSFYSAPDSIRLAWEGYHYWADWANHIDAGRTLGDDDVAQYRECGGFVTRCPASQSFLSKVVPLSEQLGIPFETWSRARAERALGMDLTAYGPPARINAADFGAPARDAGAVDGGVFFPRTGYVSDPQLATRNVQRAAEATGLARFAFGERVVRVLRRSVGSGVRAGARGHNAVRAAGVQLESGAEARAPVIVNAAGPHSHLVTAMAFADAAPGVGPANDMRVTTRPFRVEVAYLDAPHACASERGGPDAAFAEADGAACERGSSPRPPAEAPKASDGGPSGPVSPCHVVVTDMDCGFYSRPDVGGKLLVGGVEPECDKAANIGFRARGAPPGAATPRDEGAGFEGGLTEEWDNYAYRLALRYPQLRIPNHSPKGIVACYDVTEDWMPVYDRSALDGFYLAVGTSGNQFKNAGPAGAMMAAIVQRCEAGHDHDGDPLRFRLERTGETVDTSAWSRLRTVQDTTGTVLS
jgi:sarcosine oxidase subunit beta